MSVFVDRGAFDVIKLRGGNQVRVRRGLSAAEDAALQDKLVQMEFDTETRSARVISGQLMSHRLSIVKAYVLDWDFTDGEGKVVPYKPEAVDELRPEVAREIAEAIDGLETIRQEGAEKKELTPSAT